MIKLSNRELDRIDAYRVKCFNNALNQGKSLPYAMKAFIYSEKAAFQTVLGETRPGERGWWNSPPMPDHAGSDAESEGELCCAICKRKPGEVEALVFCDDKFRCEACVMRRRKPVRSTVPYCGETWWMVKPPEHPPVGCPYSEPVLPEQ